MTISPKTQISDLKFFHFSNNTTNSITMPSTRRRRAAVKQQQRRAAEPESDAPPRRRTRSQSPTRVRLAFCVRARQPGSHVRSALRDEHALPHHRSPIDSARWYACCCALVDVWLMRFCHSPTGRGARLGRCTCAARIE